ncbi:MAG: hypothetical protein GOP50_08625 [Candidatus Heimdallarchaeota archaeon]|nr:hypothetical protein [Candidatus Heimdallarchaeota archaeon]
MSVLESTSKFFKSIGDSIVKYFQLIPRLWKIIGLETFIFATFVGICAVISEGIMLIPSSTLPGLNFLFAGLKVGLSLLLVGMWLTAWYFLTKRLMRNDGKKETEIIEEEV